MGLPARFCLVGLLACAACAPADEGTDSTNSAAPDSSVTASNPVADAATNIAPAANTADAGASSGADAAVTKPNTDGGAGTARDASVTDAAEAMVPALVLEVPTSTVTCGGEACDTLANVCCSSWSKASGFTDAESCVVRSDCYKKFGRAGDSNRAVTRECDGKEDCSAGQVCCVYADGMPLFTDYLNPVDLLGPGGSTICADAMDCVYNNRSTFIANGIALGEFECNDNTDCADRPGTTCQAEVDNSHSTGAGVKARPRVKVCR
jgi:hypothetical protein